MKIETLRELLCRIMFLLNAVIIICMVVVFAATPAIVARSGAALDFIQKLDHLPAKPWTLGIAVVCGLGIVGLHRYFNNEKNGVNSGSHWLFWVELLLAVAIVLSLHLDYNGVFLLVIVDLIDKMTQRERMSFLGVVIVLYLLTSLDVLQVTLGMVPAASYFGCYLSPIRQLMLSGLGLCVVFNSILFIVYMVLLFSQRTAENEQIRNLNLELERANDRLSVMNEQLKAYASESERMAETRERNRLAREIHDTLGHALTGITAGADACLQMIDISTDMAKKQMEIIASTARQGMSEVRRSVKALRPDALEHLELREALGKLCEEMQRSTHTVIDLDINAEQLRLSPDEEDTIYRTVQESITNSIRHGKAKVVQIAMYRDGRRLYITIQDNGIGCQTVLPGFGLRHMRERLNLLNGTLKWSGTKGFRIEVMIPLRWGEEV